MNLNIGIEDKGRKAAAKLLGGVLADESVLLVKTKNYHWNVVGPDFMELHEFFDGQYGKIAGFVDELAERVRSVGEKAPGTMAEFLKDSGLKEKPGEVPAAKQ